MAGRRRGSIVKKETRGGSNSFAGKFESAQEHLDFSRDLVPFNEACDRCFHLAQRGAQIRFQLKRVADDFASVKFRNVLVEIDSAAEISIKSKFVCKFPQLERADYIIRVTFDTGFG